METAGGLEAIDDVHYDGRVSFVLFVQKIYGVLEAGLDVVLGCVRVCVFAGW